MQAKVILKCSRVLLLMVGIGGVVVSCASSHHSKKQSQEKSWSESMQGLSAEVREILPFIYSKQETYEGKEKQQILEILERFGKSSHNISPKMGKPFFGDDPLLEYSLSSLENDVQRAQFSFELGRVKYSKNVLKTVMGHCFRCHSTTDVGSKAHWKVGHFSGLSINPSEKADLLVATRQYKEALTNLEAELTDPSFVQSQPYEFERSLRKYINLVVRIEKSPKRSLETFGKINNMKAVPFYLSQKIASWESALDKWQEEKSRKDSLKEASRLLRAANTQKSFMADTNGEVYTLRATAVLHRLNLQKHLPADQAKILAMLGEAYGTLEDLSEWSLHEAYFEQCIRTAPKTKLAKQCFARLEESIYMGFSGSAGVFIPEAEKVRLKKLKDLL